MKINEAFLCWYRVYFLLLSNLPGSSFHTRSEQIPSLFIENILLKCSPFLTQTHHKSCNKDKDILILIQKPKKMLEKRCFQMKIFDLETQVAEKIYGAFWKDTGSYFHFIPLSLLLLHRPNANKMSAPPALLRFMQ